MAGAGAWLARLQKSIANQGGAGRQVTFGGTAYTVLEKAVERRAAEDLASGLGLNLANADIREWVFSANDFTSSAVYPLEEMDVQLTEGSQTRTYQIAKQRVEVHLSTDIAVHTTVYRKPPTTTQQSTELAGDPNPGQNVNTDFAGPINPH